MDENPGPCESGTDADAAAVARKRRIQLRSKKRPSLGDGAEGNSDDDAPMLLLNLKPFLGDINNTIERNAMETDPPPPLPPPVAKVARRQPEPDTKPAPDPGPKPKPSLTGIKKNARYCPGVAMTREELVAWRKEARRIRNRESAAASRQRIRNRVTELESEYDIIKSKYTQALQRIVELEAAAACAYGTTFANEESHSTAASDEDTTSLSTRRSEQDHYSPRDISFARRTDEEIGNSLSPVASSNTSFSASLPQGIILHSSSRGHEYQSRDYFSENRTCKDNQHIIKTISRPIA